MLKHVLKCGIQGLGYELARRRAPDLPFVHHLECDGERLRFWIVSEHTRSWWAHPSLSLDAELRFFRTHCMAGGTVLEIGAHHGLHTLLMSRWVGPTGAVHAFEANPDNALVLCANIGLNRLTWCEAVAAAAAASTRPIKLAGETVNTAGGGGGGDALSVDDYLRRAGLAGVDLLKVDVEGFEAHVLAGASELLRHRPAIDLELHLDDLARYGTSVEDVLRLLAWEEYDVEAMARPDWQTVTRVTGAQDLPAAGVVDLFFHPKRRQ